MSTALQEAQNPTPAPEAQQVDLRAYWRVIAKRRWLIGATFLIAVALTAAYALRLPKIYSATATMVIDASSPKVLGTGVVQDVAESTAPYWFSKEYYETQYNVMKSRIVSDRVAQKVRTARDDKFLNLDAVPTQEMRDAGLRALSALRAQVNAAAEPAVILMGRLGVEPVKESRVVRLSVDDQDPVLAAALVNAFSQAYMDYNLASKTATTSEANESLETELPDLESKLQKSAAELSDFKKRHDIVSASWEDKQNVVTQRYARISEELTTTRLKQAAIKARADSIIGTAEGQPRERCRACRARPGDARADSSVAENEIARPSL